MPTISKIQSFGLPVGSVIQTQTDFDADAVLHTNTDSSQPETILSASITPTNANHKILVMGLIHVGVLYSSRSGTLHYIGCRLFRGNTEIGKAANNDTMTSVHGADASGGRVAHSVMAGGTAMSSKPTFIPFHFIDSPNTTSAITYNVKGFIEQYNGQYTMIVNGSGYRYNNDEQVLASSNLTLMEIVA